MPSEQIAIRVPGEQLSQLDEMVARGAYASRAAAVRAGIEAVVERERRRGVDLAVVEGYQQMPPNPGERDAALASLTGAIVEEPW